MSDVQLKAPPRRTHTNQGRRDRRSDATTVGKRPRWPQPDWVERKAQRLLEFCLRNAGYSRLAAPVPIEEWAETVLGIRVEVADLSYLGAGVLGAAFTTSRTVQIDPSIEHDDSRFRFTLAHDVGHLVLHPRHARSFRDGDLTILHDRGLLETQANRFASYVLMPFPLLEQTLFEACTKYGMNPPGYISALTRPGTCSLWLWRHRFLPHITSRLGVSLSAAIYRFANLRLPWGEPFLPRCFVPRLLAGETNIRPDVANIVERCRGTTKEYQGRAVASASW